MAPSLPTAGFTADGLEPERAAGFVVAGEKERVVAGHPGGATDGAIEGVGDIGAVATGNRDDELRIFVVGLAIAGEGVGDVCAIGREDRAGFFGQA